MTNEVSRSEVSRSEASNTSISFLNPSNKSYRLNPEKYRRINKWLEKHYSTIWFDAEIDMKQDVLDWETLTKDEKYFISKTLAFFAASDFLVNEAIAKDEDEVTINEYRM